MQCLVPPRQACARHRATTPASGDHRRGDRSPIRGCANKIEAIYDANYRVYGVRKMWKALRRDGIEVGRDRVARLMRQLDIQGAKRGKRRRTTTPDETASRPADLVERNFSAIAPNELWVADFTYVSTWTGVVYVAFIIDVYSRTIVGWRLSTSMRTDLVLDALEMALWFRDERNESLVHHSDRGSQYLSIRYGERLADAGVIASVGSRGDSYDNAVAETTIGLYKTELVRNRGPWRNADQLELATLEWVSWFNHTRLHGACGDVPPAELEANYYRQIATAEAVVSQ